MRHEYRVTWRRQDWLASTAAKSRTFSRWHDAALFCAKLQGDGRPDLAPLSVLRLDQRNVGQWEPVP